MCNEINMTSSLAHVTTPCPKKVYICSDGKNRFIFRTDSAHFLSCFNRSTLPLVFV